MHQKRQWLSPLFVIFVVSTAIRLQTRSRLHRGTSTANRLKKSASSSLRRRCVLRRNLVSSGQPIIETPTMAEVHEDKSLAARRKSCASFPVILRELRFLRCALFFVSLTRKMHYHPCKSSSSFSFSVHKRKRSRRLPREEEQPRGLHQGQLIRRPIKGERIGRDTSFRPSIRFQSTGRTND